MQEGKVGREISISDLKRNFTQKFPDSPLTPVLLYEPDTMSEDDLIAKTGTWLAFLQRKRSL
jgi:hypothetical protein